MLLWYLLGALQVLCRPDNFSQLVDLTITPCDSGWLEQLMLMLKSNHELKSLAIKSVSTYFHHYTSACFLINGLTLKHNVYVVMFSVLYNYPSFVEQT